MSLLEGQESEEEVEPSRPLNYPHLAANLCLRLFIRPEGVKLMLKDSSLIFT